MKQVEAMLMLQAIGLQTLSARLIERRANEHIPGFETNMRMALRAQNQCRTTLETLAGIKNPPVVYARQANVTTGPQQVNNGVSVPPHAREIEIKQTQLSEGNHELLPDTGASQAKGRIDPAVAPLENSTGPRTDAGKARSARRGFKGNERAPLLELRRLLREQENLLKAL